MRALLVVALAACGGSPDEEPCPVVLTSEVQHEPARIVSGKHMVGVSWTRRSQTAREEVHAAIISPDGSRTPDIALPDVRMRGAVGVSTLLWTPDNTCAPAMNEALAFDVILQRGGTVRFVDHGPTNSRVAIFDGQRYQLFWIPTFSGNVHHQTLDEDGTVSAVRMLPHSGYCVDAATDGAGTTFIRVDDRGYIFDAAAGTTRLAFTSPATGGPYGQTFYFAQQFHVATDAYVFSIAPTSTGASTMRPLIGHLQGARDFAPTETTMLVSAMSGVVEVDAAWAKLRDALIPRFYDFGVLDADVVRFEKVPADAATQMPGFVDLIREGAWRKELAVDSPLREAEQCGDIAL
jgi:hypothetical protein